MLVGVRRAHLDLRFRPPRPSDEPFVLRVGRRVFARWSRDPGRSLAGMMASPSARMIVAEEASRPIGFAIVEVAPLGKPFGPWEAPAVGRLDAIAIDPEEQRRGAGRLLLEEAERVARDAGAVVMTLMTARTNRFARRLFVRGGFLPLQQVERAYANGDDAVEMFKLVG